MLFICCAGDSPSDSTLGGRGQEWAESSASGSQSTPLATAPHYSRQKNPLATDYSREETPLATEYSREETPLATDYSRGETDLTPMRREMSMEQMGSAIIRSYFCISRAEMMTPTLPSVSATICRNTPVNQSQMSDVYQQHQAIRGQSERRTHCIVYNNTIYCLLYCLPCRICLLEPFPGRNLSRTKTSLRVNKPDYNN